MTDGTGKAPHQGSEGTPKAADSVGLLYGELGGSEDPDKGEDPAKAAEPDKVDAADVADPKKGDDPDKSEGPDDSDKGEDPDDPDKGEDPEKDEDPDKGEDDENTISTSAQLVEHLEADPEWFEGLKVPVKVNGEQAEASIGDLVKSYQIGEAAERRLEDAKAKAQSITEDAAEKSKQVEATYAVAAKMLETLEDELDRDIKAIDWDKLREEDSAEYAAKKADVAERKDRLNTVKQQAAESYQETLKQANDDRIAALKQHAQTEHAALLEAIPEWKDAEKAKAGKVQVIKYLSDMGFSENELANIVNHRVLVMARNSMLFEESQKKVSTAKKRVAKVPKTMKPGTKPGTQPKPKDNVELLYGS
ncbi:hypothetical protein [Methyloceanibacter caenitepidi]|uniref:Phage protein n=1 Tax=Methyloceanibacter caenitepidi TaxID=1384459 RepID=A0A0A8K4K8_9HYPH|nr:hypothetical protein [Methyloceanibacter caenitepidi]BAQ16919.1 hypothetical protein GL4_1463 [Methyloceanibacter caenitepidi]